MPKIRLLDKRIAEMIAAGEVVERPASVIKELVENAVDAEASVITVEIRGGGSAFMRITDNGCGIAKEDVPTAYLRHATSKVKDENDLAAIATLGFRGEALASISAVARVEMLTKTKEEPIGIRYTVNGGDEETFEEAGCPDGTTILIRDLFFNTPARMKFLKKDVTEGNAIAGIVDKIALSHPEISFRFIRDGKEQLHTPGDGKLFSAVYAVFGKEFSSGLIPVDYELQNIKVSGYISKPTASRANRSMQNFFINNRFIRSKTASVALDEAYKGAVMVGKYAACVLNLQLSFEAVDVNVHPAKLEVRFVNERPIFDAVYHAVKSALSQDDSKKVMTFTKPLPLPQAPVEKAEQMHLPFLSGSANSAAGVTTPVQTDIPARKITMPSFGRTMQDSGSERGINKPNVPVRLDILVETDDCATEKQNSFTDFSSSKPYQNDNPEKDNVERELPKALQLSADSETENKPSLIEPHAVTRYIGEAFDTYIILQYGTDAVMLIDKHAAHERLLYEKIKKEAGESAGQVLLQPVTVTLDKEAYTKVLENLEPLAYAGFEAEDFGPGTILIRSAPLFLDGSDIVFAFEEMAGYLVANKTDLTTEHLDWLYANIACRAAIKGGNKSTDEELIALVELLEANPAIKYCPHGRPINMLIKRYDIETQFGR